MSDSVQNGSEDTPLFDCKILKQLDFSICKRRYKPAISISAPGDSLVLRPLCLEDFDRGFVQLLSQLTKVGDLTRGKFTDRFYAMKSCHHGYYIVVIEDVRTNQVIGTATLVVEQKFIHEAATRGRVEDVVVNDQYRGKQLGKLLLDVLTLLSHHIGCYKITLECKDRMIEFYNQFGFTKDEGNNYMVRRFKHHCCL